MIAKGFFLLARWPSELEDREGTCFSAYFSLNKILGSPVDAVFPSVS